MSKIWKWLFLGLLALNLALVSVVAYRIMTPVETTSSVSLPKGATKIGKYSMTREELDAALTGFAQDYSTDKMRFKVKVTNSKIVFESSYKVLGHPVPLYVYFTPVVSESGAIVLHVSELSAGTLKLPVSDVLKMIKRSTNLPDYIAIDSKKGKVTLNIQSMKNEKGITARAQSLDLVNDFENLGIKIHLIFCYFVYKMNFYTKIFKVLEQIKRSTKNRIFRYNFITTRKYI